MQEIKIEATADTPEVHFHPDGKLLLSGRSYSENPKKFYAPLLEWCKTIVKNEILFELKLEYLNTSASKSLYELLNTVANNEFVNKLNVNWFYESDDEEMLETGEILAGEIKSANFTYREMAIKQEF